MWARWDSEWYLLIAEKGYGSFEWFKDYGKGRYLPQETSKFFPAYPIGIRILNFVIRNSVLSGILLSNLCSILFLFFFYELANKYMDETQARRATIYYIVFPTSFFLSAVYSEALFLAAVCGAFYFIEERKILPALLATAIAALTRSQGFLVLPALVWLSYVRIRERKMQSAVLVTLAGLAGLAGYLLFVQATFGSYRWVSDSIAYWRGGLQYPGYAFVRFALSNIAIHGQHNSLIDFSFAMLNVIVLGLSFRKFPGPYILYSSMVVIFPLFSTLFSFSRLCLVNFPMFFWLGRYTGRVSTGLQIFFAMLLAFFMAAFANWYWAG
jgi:Gpi18-like mannosyltransferase